MEDHLIVGTESDNPFAIDIARFFGQPQDVSDLISLKCFANSEFCPRFITPGTHEPGLSLEGRRVSVVSSASIQSPRNSLAMRSLLVARAAVDNGATGVTLVEPDLFYSAQDRGPRPDQGDVHFERDHPDLAKFDGQPFSSRLYAQMLALAGVDEVITVHNHSPSVGSEFGRSMRRGYHNLSPARLFARYVFESDVANTTDGGAHLVLCAPDKGALSFAREVRDALGLPHVRLLQLEKSRRGERNVTATLAPDSEVGFDHAADKDVLIVDDMVRTGSTILECCRRIRAVRANRVIFAVTHFYSSEECREILNHPVLDEIITTNTIPTILNRDMQGRLRRKMVVLKLERWIARFLRERAGRPVDAISPDVYSVDMSSKHPRWVPTQT